MSGKIFDYLKQQVNFSQWYDYTNLSQNLFVWRFFLSSQDLPEWQPHSIQQLESRAGGEGSLSTISESDQPPNSTLVRSVWERREGQPEVVQRMQRVKLQAPSPDSGTESSSTAHTTYSSLIKSLWKRPDETRRVLINVNIHECTSRKAAHELLLQLLAQFQLPNVRRREGNVGDVAFSGPDELFILFARGNLVYFVRNAGLDTIPVTAIAEQLDSELISKPDVADSPAGSLRIERVAAVHSDEAAPRIGEVIPLDVAVMDSMIVKSFAAPSEQAFRAMKEQPVSARPVMYKVFSSTGEAFQQEGQLVYLPHVSGPQEIMVFAINAERRAASKNLQINVRE